MREKRGAPAAITTAIGSRVTGLEAGGLLAFLSNKVLGQFDPFYTGPMDRSGRRPRRPAAPGRAEHRPRRARAGRRPARLPALGVPARGDPPGAVHRGAVAARPPAGRDGGPSREHRPRPGRSSPSMMRDGIETRRASSSRATSEVSPARRAPDARSRRHVLDRITAVMSLLEGHADVVMDGVGPEVVPRSRKIRAKFTKRRAGAGPLDQMIRRLLGFDAKLRQYRDGARFVRGAIDKVGHGRLQRGLGRAREPADPQDRDRRPGRLGHAESTAEPRPDGWPRAGSILRSPPYAGRSGRAAPTSSPAPRVLVACSGGADSTGAGRRRGRSRGRRPAGWSRRSSSTTACSPARPTVAAAARQHVPRARLRPPSSVVTVDVGHRRRARGRRPQRAVRRPRTPPAERAAPPSCSATPATTRPRPSCSGWHAGAGPGRWPDGSGRRAAFAGRSSAYAASRHRGVPARRAGSRSGTTRTTPTRRSPASGCGARCCPSSRPPSGPASPRPWPAPRPLTPRRRRRARRAGPPTCLRDRPRAQRRAGRRRARGRAGRRAPPGAPSRGAGRGQPRSDLFAVHVDELDRLVTDWHGQAASTCTGRQARRRGVSRAAGCGRRAVTLRAPCCG